MMIWGRKRKTNIPDGAIEGPLDGCSDGESEGSNDGCDEGCELMDGCGQYKRRRGLEIIHTQVCKER